MQTSNTTGRNGFQARSTSVGTKAAVASAVSAPTKKKTTGEVVFRVKRKGEEGELFNGKQIKWKTIGSLYKNTVEETGEVYYSFSASEPIAAGVHKAYDNSAPLA
jgi:hypothetical protein